jgi:hypothetical protein
VGEQVKQTAMGFDNNPPVLSAKECATIMLFITIQESKFILIKE